MPGTRTDFGQMFDHELNPRFGWSGDRGLALEKTLPVGTNNNKVFAGSVVFIDDGNVFKLGVPTGTTVTRTRIPCFAFQNEDDFDVNPDLGNIAGGVLMALCALGTFELESTEFDPNQTYTTGTYLTADSGANATGQLAPGTLGTDTIVGIVSETGPNTDGSFENEHGENVIRFYTWFMPSNIAAA